MDEDEMKMVVDQVEKTATMLKAMNLDSEQIRSFLGECETAEVIGPLLNPSEYMALNHDTYEKNTEIMRKLADLLELLEAQEE